LHVLHPAVACCRNSGHWLCPSNLTKNTSASHPCHAPPPLKQGLDGSPYAGEDLTNGGDVHFFDQYVIRQLGSPREARIPL
jgi:hypothetical protein